MHSVSPLTSVPGSTGKPHPSPKGLQVQRTPLPSAPVQFAGGNWKDTLFAWAVGLSMLLGGGYHVYKNHFATNVSEVKGYSLAKNPKFIGFMIYRLEAFKKQQGGPHAVYITADGVKKHRDLFNMLYPQHAVSDSDYLIDRFVAQAKNLVRSENFGDNVNTERLSLEDLQELAKIQGFSSQDLSLPQH